MVFSGVKLLFKNIGVIGAGVMGEALIAGMVKAKLVSPSHLTASDVRLSHIKLFRKKYKIQITQYNTALVQKCDCVVLCVKPQDADSVLKDIADRFHKDKMLVTIAAGLPLSFYEKRLPDGVPVVRVMPNTPCQVGAGVSVLCGGAFAKGEHVKAAAKIFNCVGATHTAGEKYLNAVTALSGSGPAYVFLFLEALTDAGVRVGLARDLAYDLAFQTFDGSCELLKQTGQTPKELKDKVTSPGGTTITALSVLEKSGFRGHLIQAVLEAANKAKELEKEAETKA